MVTRLKLAVFMETFGLCQVVPADQVTIPLYPLSTTDALSLIHLSPAQKTWVHAQQFNAQPGQVCLIPDAMGKICAVLLGWMDIVEDYWIFAQAFSKLPTGYYQLDNSCLTTVNQTKIAQIWGLCCYTFTRYKTATSTYPILSIQSLPQHAQTDLLCLLSASYKVKDWINTPAEDFGPQDFSDICHALAKRFNATIDEVSGEDLLQKNYPLVHLVGRASARKPRMLCLRWGQSTHPHIALVGKGVCFDTGGIQVKPHTAMQTMKKDMGGAAHLLGLAEMIMSSQLPISLSLWIAAVDNSISANAFLPGDVYRARNGKSIEIGHTDAEGRLILADLLAAASEEKPACIIDYATLTGAQRVALGMDLPAVFTHNTALASDLVQIGQQVQDPIWPLPLHKAYISDLDSEIADLSSTGKTPYGGAITAALFLSHFVAKEIDWLHIDASCYYPSSRPGRRCGGAVMALETLFLWIRSTFTSPTLS